MKLIQNVRTALLGIWLIMTGLLLMVSAIIAIMARAEKSVEDGEYDGSC